MTSAYSRFFLLVFVLAAAAFNAAAQVKKTNAPQPNVIVIICDDLGYADVGFQQLPASRQALTPNLDRLTREGIIVKNGYVASSTCSPSRQSLLTGRSSSRFGVEENGYYADSTEIIIPRIIKNYGYISAHFGKWHLAEDGDDTSAISPKGRGFDYSYPTLKMDPFMTKTPHPRSWKQGGMPAYGPFSPDAITDETIAFIKANKNKPFFAYVAHNAPHSPFNTKEPLMKRVVEHAPEFKAAYNRITAHAETAKGAAYKYPDFRFGEFKGENLDQELMRLTYLSMMLAVDDGVGRILQTLKDEGLRENTLIFFLSDNGAALDRPNDLGGVNLPLKGGKGGVNEGSVRVPFAVSWPGVIPAGKIDVQNIVSSMDIFTTTIELAGGKIPSDRVIDGINIIPYLSGEKPAIADRTLFFRRLGRSYTAIRKGEYKVTKVKAKKDRPSEDALYNIQSDISELNDLGLKQPTLKSELEKTFDQIVKGFPEPLDVKDKKMGVKPKDDD